MNPWMNRACLPVLPAALRRCLAVLCAGGLLAAPARAIEPIERPDLSPDAQSRPGTPGHFAVLTGETVEAGKNLWSAEAGFPGVTLGWVRGGTDRFDAGLKLDLNYAVRSTTDLRAGAQLRIPLRYLFYRNKALSVQATAELGVDLYSGACAVGTVAPLCGDAPLAFNVGFGAVGGYQVSPTLRVALAAELPVHFNLRPDTYLVSGLLFGPAVEILLAKDWSVGFSARFGPQVQSLEGRSSRLGAVAQVAIGYRK
jgi:hypothetical protein